MRFALPNCGGCRTCELACGFHHQGMFTPSVSSLRVLDAADPTYREIEVLESDSDIRHACDGCQDEQEPLCVSFCREGDQLRQLLQGILTGPRAPVSDKATRVGDKGKP